MNVCHACRLLNNDLAAYCERCGRGLTSGGVAGNTTSLVQSAVGSAELDRLLIGGTASLGQTNAAQQFFRGVVMPDDDGRAEPTNGPTGRTSAAAPEWDQ